MSDNEESRTFSAERTPILRQKNSRGSSLCSFRMLVILGVTCVLVCLVIILALSASLGTYYGLKSTKISLADNIKSDNLRQLLMSLQNTSVDNSRSVLTGYNNSADFVIETLIEHGYTPNKQHFTIPVPQNSIGSFKIKLSTSDLEIEFAQFIEFYIALYSAGCIINDDTTCTWTMVTLVDDVESDYGCDTVSEDITDKAVLLSERGNCSFYDKAINLEQAGAKALIFAPFDFYLPYPAPVVIGNKNEDGSVSYANIVTIGVTSDVGEQLVNFLNYDSEMEAIIEIFTTITNVTTFNIFAETNEGRDDRVIMFGSHLDSVPEGPGINDDGSGSMTNLEVAIQISKLGLKPVNKVKFAWWGAEELGLFGSHFYVNTLNQTEKDQISLYLNFDMLASPNYVRGVYDARSAMNEDLSFSGMTTIQNLFIKYFNDTKKSYKLVEFGGGSDYQSFLDAGILAGGVATGAGEYKTEEDWQLFGGLRNAPLDSCYHQACDTINNIEFTVYQEMSRAAAYTLQILMEQDNLDDFLKNGI